MIKGKPIFNGLAVLEFSCTYHGGRSSPYLDAKAAFVQTEDVGERKAGATHGYTTCAGKWSPATLKKLEELCDSMEQDIALRHFYDLALPTVGISPENVGGIGEILTDEDGNPQV